MNWLWILYWCESETWKLSLTEFLMKSFNVIFVTSTQKTFYWSSTFLTKRNKIYSLNTNEKWVISIQLKKC